MTTDTKFPFHNTDLPLRDRVADLVSRLTLDEKIESMVQYQPAVERLGIRAYKHGTEAAHGVAWLGEATSFPQPIGLGCTWNTELLERIGSVIGDEARVYYDRNPEVNGLTLWAPTVDLERDPRWGRNEEAYGEDPKLTGELASGLSRGMRGDHPRYVKAIATLKHFICNNNEVNRGSCSASIDPRNMKEYYQAAFKPVFVKGGARSMMTSYNSVNGIPTILHGDVKKVVTEEWGMDGFIVSDAGDLLGLVNDHHYYETYKEAVAHAIKAGIDSITDDKEKSCGAIREALEDGLLAESDLDTALANTFRVRFMLGEFDPATDNPYANTPESKLCAPEHAELSREAARQSIVLLKNDGGTLPLRKDEVQSVAVSGLVGNKVYRDWYSGTLPYQVSALDGIRGKLAGKRVAYSTGSSIVSFHTADGRPLVIDEGNENRLSAGKPGAEAEHFELTDWGWGSLTLQSATTGKLLTSADDVHIAANADEAFGWFVKEVLRLEAQPDGSLVLCTWNGLPVAVPAGEGPLVVNYERGVGEGDRLARQVVCDGIAEAAGAAAGADVSIVVAGNNPLINGKEEIDRPGLELPAEQQALIKASLAVNPHTVVVIVGSYPFALGELAEQIPAIVYLSHAGQELGHALADVLFGDYSPAGRLNMTWYQSEDQLTDIMDYDIIKSKRTYLYLEDKPLYPFGHGLGYARFSYGSLSVESSGSGLDDFATVRFSVSNESDFAASEVAQLYVSMAGSRVQRPLKKLVGFTRLTVGPGETAQVELRVDAEELAIWDVTRERFCLERGSYTFMAGASSDDVRLSATIDIDGEVIPPRNLGVATKAENYDDYEGVYLDEGEQGGSSVTPVSESGWILFRDVAWPEGAGTLRARVSAGEAGGDITVRVNSAAGETLGSLLLEGEDGKRQWRDVEVALDGAASSVTGLALCLKGSVRLAAVSVG